MAFTNEELKKSFFLHFCVWIVPHCECIVNVAAKLLIMYQQRYMVSTNTMGMLMSNSPLMFHDLASCLSVWEMIDKILKDCGQHWAKCIGISIIKNLLLIWVTVIPTVHEFSIWESAKHAYQKGQQPVCAGACIKTYMNAYCRVICDCLWAQLFTCSTGWLSFTKLIAWLSF